MFIILKFEWRFPRKNSKHFMESIWHVPNGIEFGEKQLTSMGPQDPKTRVTLPTKGPKE
jgi:hypothetical protein